MIVPCECGAKLKIDDAKLGNKGVKVRCPRCGNILLARKPAPLREADAGFSPVRSTRSAGTVVLVAHDSPVVRDMVCNVLADAGFGAETAADGVEVLKKAMEISPAAVVLDVGLPGIYGFELCERLKGDPLTRNIKIILLASVYDATRYKRSPVSLYGADDYIEKHHIPDQLPRKLSKLLFPEQAQTAASPPASGAMSREFDPSLLSQEFGMGDGAGPVPQAPTPEERGFAAAPFSFDQYAEPAQEGPAITPESFSLDASIFQKEECDIPRVDEADPEAVEKAKRFARIIVSDIALYNQEAVAEGLKRGTFYDLLRNDITEGRDLYEKRVPAVIKSKKDYYQEAFDNFIAAQQNAH